MENGNSSIFCTLVEPILVNKIMFNIWWTAGIIDKNARASMNKQTKTCGEEVQRVVEKFREWGR